MTAYVNIAVAERKDTLLVPNAALRYKPANGEVQKPRPAEPDGRQCPQQRRRTRRCSGVKSGHQTNGDTFAGKVYILENGKLKPVSVMFGITDNRNTEIASGDLKAGDLVVLGETQAANQSRSSGSRPMRLF